MTLELQPGSTFGDYTLERRLGSGGFGDVWLSHDASGVVVALKVLHGQHQTGQAARMRAEIELLAATASTGSQHIVHVLAGGSEPAPYVVMEYIEGTDLGREIALKGSMPVLEVLRVASGIADALAVLQLGGIIHRDIKPGNVMIDRQGVVKLTDFGIAKIVGVDSITTTNQVPMSVAYAAPEVFEGKVSYLSDHYAFGALLFHCLAGRPPFTGSYAELYRHHLLSPPDLTALPGSTPAALVRLIDACLKKTPEERPVNATSLLAAVTAAQQELLAEMSATIAQPRLREPRQLGPWLIDGRSDEGDWLFDCHQEATGEQARVEVHFSDDLTFGDQLRQRENRGTSRVVLRPGEGWVAAPAARFVFWLAQPSMAADDVSTVIVPRPSASVELAATPPQETQVESAAPEPAPAPVEAPPSVSAPVQVAPSADASPPVSVPVQDEAPAAHVDPPRVAAEAQPQTPPPPTPVAEAQPQAPVAHAPAAPQTSAPSPAARVQAGASRAVADASATSLRFLAYTKIAAVLVLLLTVAVSLHFISDDSLNDPPGLLKVGAIEDISMAFLPLVVALAVASRIRRRTSTGETKSEDEEGIGIEGLAFLILVGLAALAVVVFATTHFATRYRVGAVLDAFAYCLAGVAILSASNKRLGPLRPLIAAGGGLALVAGAGVALKLGSTEGAEYMLTYISGSFAIGLADRQLLLFLYGFAPALTLGALAIVWSLSETSLLRGKERLLIFLLVPAVGAMLFLNMMTAIRMHGFEEAGAWSLPLGFLQHFSFTLCLILAALPRSSNLSAKVPAGRIGIVLIAILSVGSAAWLSESVFEGSTGIWIFLSMVTRMLPMLIVGLALLEDLASPGDASPQHP